MNFSKDFLPIGFPAVLPWLKIPLGKILLYVTDQFFHLGKTTIAYTLLCDIAKKPLHEV